MDKNKQYKIALVLYTQGLDYDDRIRKEILSIQKLFPNISFKIFAVEPKNREEEGLTSYGVPYRIPFLRTREKYASASHTMAKAWDFYKTIKHDLKQFDAIWCADPETFIFVLMIHGKPIAWDLHELPGRFMHKPIWKMLFRFAEKKVRVMIHANEPRLKHLQSLGIVRQPVKQFVLRNYPQFNEIDSEYDETYQQFDTWLGTAKCVYLQGIVDERRADRESVEAVMAIEGLKAVVVGSTRSDLIPYLKTKYSDQELSERLFFTGRIKQLKTPQYIRRCFMSLIFYKNISANNWYCEPNRLFQNIINGNPVVVGNNPPMKELVEKYDIGICADTDGNELSSIVVAIKQLISRYDEIKQNLSIASQHLIWDDQEETIVKIVNKFLI